MNYKGVEYVVRARPGRDQWTFTLEALTPQRSALVDHEMKQLPLRAAGLMVG
jgi:hypothetical protein